MSRNLSGCHRVDPYTQSKRDSNTMFHTFMRIDFILFPVWTFRYGLITESVLSFSESARVVNIKQRVFGLDQRNNSECFRNK